MIWAAMSSAGVGPLCFLKSTVNAAIYQEILKHFMLPSADKLYGDADFIFQQDLAPTHTAKGTKSWFNDHGVTVLDWPANSPDLNPLENLCCFFKIWRVLDPLPSMGAIRMRVQTAYKNKTISTSVHQETNPSLSFNFQPMFSTTTWLIILKIIIYVIYYFFPVYRLSCSSTGRAWR